ncbi:MAG: L,D-transpeptidase [Beijerinckiaceae bacterium]
MFTSSSRISTIWFAVAGAIAASSPSVAQESAAAFFSAPFNQPGFVAPSGGSVRHSAIPRQTVSYSGRHRPGTIVISTKERRLYYVQPGGQAIKYGVGVGRPGFTWGGVKRISRKAEWPGWTPPPQMLRRRPDLPRHMKGGPDNPLGARALYLGSSLYRIHGSNEPGTIGQAVSSGCIRMTNEDVIDLYSRVRVGTTVVVQR